MALDFEVSIESLKIACNFPEIKPKKKTYIMDCLVFLDKVKVEDMAHEWKEGRDMHEQDVWDFRHLILYAEDKEAESDEQY